MTCKLIIWTSGLPRIGPTIWWSKFYYQTAQELGVDTVMTEGEIGEKLNEYGAKFVRSAKELYLEFDDEQYVSLFLLRYS